MVFRLTLVRCYILFKVTHKRPPEVPPWLPSHRILCKAVAHLQKTAQHIVEVAPRKGLQPDLMTHLLIPAPAAVPAIQNTDTFKFDVAVIRYEKIYNYINKALYIAFACTEISSILPAAAVVAAPRARMTGCIVQVGEGYH